MKRTTAGRLAAIAVATLVMLPSAGLAQTAPPQTPPSQAQPPATAQPPQGDPAPPQSTTPDATQAAAKMHLTAARNALSQLTQLPAAGQLQGDARAQISDLINNFNELITKQSDWKASYDKVENNLATLVGAPSDPGAAPAGAVGTSGKIDLDQGIREKLVEFRAHLQKFEEVASGMAPPPEDTRSSAPPANQPAEPPPPDTPDPPDTPEPPDVAPPTTPDDEPDPAIVGPAELLQHIEAIEAMINEQAAAQSGGQAPGAVGTAGAPQAPNAPAALPEVRFTQDQLAQIRVHLMEMRRAIDRR